MLNFKHLRRISSNERPLTNVFILYELNNTMYRQVQKMPLLSCPQCTRICSHSDLCAASVDVVEVAIDRIKKTRQSSFGISVPEVL